GKTVALIGVEGLVVVDTPDALLVTSKERSADVKTVVDRLRREERDDLLSRRGFHPTAPSGVRGAERLDGSLSALLYGPGRAALRKGPPGGGLSRRPRIGVCARRRV